MKRQFVLGAIVLAGGVGTAILHAQQAAAPQGRGGGPAFPPVSAAEKVADNLYMVPGQGGNTAVWVMANGVLLVDTKLADNGQAILDEVKKVTDKPVTHIVNTHTHGDHTGSNQFFPGSVQIVVHEKTAANMAKMPVFQEAANKQGLSDRTYKDKLTLLSGNDAIDLYYFGPAHTNGDTFVVFRNLRVMHTGDAFATKGIPFIDPANGGSGLQYPDTFAKAAAGIKGVDRIITGHITGPNSVQAWQDFVDYGEFNRLFVTAARDAVKSGKGAQQAASDLVLPEKFKGYSLTNFRGGADANITIIMEELKTAK